MAHKKQRTTYILIGLALAIIAVMFLLCVFEPIGWCPNYCSDEGLAGGGNSGGNNSEGYDDGICQPGIILRAEIPATLDAIEAICDADGYDYTETSKEVSCEVLDDAYPIDCFELESNDLYTQARETCLGEANAEWRCQLNWVGCYCPGTTPFPNSACDTMWTDGSLNCGGDCRDTQDSCIGEPGDCQCGLPCDWYPYDEFGEGYYYLALIGGFDVCGGYCANGEICAPTGDDCLCQDPDNTCHSNGDRTCGGFCENSWEECVYDPKYEDCYCQSYIL